MPYILVVEDDVDVRGITMLALQDAGYKVMGASTGLDALLFITEPKHKTRPFLILLDLAMPVMSGQKFLQVLNCCDHLSDIPVVIVSGGSDLPEGYATLMKPMQLDKLLETAKDHWVKAGRPGTSHPRDVTGVVLKP